MKRALLVLVVLVIVAAAVMWRAPASLAGKAIQARTGGRIALADTTGTVWEGRGVLVSGDARLPIAWRLHPSPLLDREAVIDLLPATPGADTPRGALVVRDGSVSARGLRLSIPAALLADAAGQRTRFVAGGTIDIASDTLAWSGASTTGNLRTQWHDATVGLAGGPPVPLGEVSADLVADQQRFAGPVRNVGGDIDIAGDIAVAMDGSGALHALVRPRPNAPSRIDSVRPLGTEHGDGVRLDWQWGAR